MNERRGVERRWTPQARPAEDEHRWGWEGSAEREDGDGQSRRRAEAAQRHSAVVDTVARSRVQRRRRVSAA